MLQALKRFADRVTDKITGIETNWEELEADLIAADFGARFSTEFVDRLRERKSLLVHGFQSNDVDERARKQIREVFGTFDTGVPSSLGRPVHVVLMTGVNGVGKTTSAAKLARVHRDAGRKVRLAAADTFRAAAIEQLQTWGQRLDVPVTAAAYGADPAAVAFTAFTEARTEGSDVLIIDTAGRQHTKGNLMQELAKVSRALKKIEAAAPHEALLVVDSNTGSNSLQQAKEFGKMVPLTGLVATKFDGAGLGGGLVAIVQECQLRPRWIGSGETIADFEPFRLERYFEKLFA